CSPTNTCTACIANEQCASAACLPDGSCADAATALYVSPSGSDTAACNPADKCSLSHAIMTADATKKLIVLDAGSYAPPATLSIAKDVTLLGRGAEIVKGGVDGPAISISGGASVTMYYTTIKRGLNNAGIACANATLVARYVTLARNDTNGLNATACNITVDR